MITIQGLTPKQHALCDIMWGLENKEDVEKFIATLPKRERLECRSLIQLMMLAFIDEVSDVSLAQSVLKGVLK